ncbi:MAG: PLP-dependent aminotransferase family protein [Oscillospiraceae bacterium]
MLTYELDKTSSEPLYVQIYTRIKDDIERGIVSANDKLPSKRSLASNLGVSVITVENAYNQLIAEGYIRSVPQKGYFAEKLGAAIPTEKPAVSRPTPPASLESDSENKLFPFTTWAKLMREELSSNQEKLLTKPPFEGVYELRSAISRHLKQFRNITASPEQIIIGAGSEYLYMLMNILFGSRSVFAVEEPGYSKIAEIYANYGMKCERIPVLSDGIDTDYLQNIKANVIHLSPSHHFPTGVITSVSKRYALLEWASHSSDRFIIEDDYDSEFRLSGKPIPSMYSIDMMDKVIYMNTFSKSLSSTIRISYMVLPPDLLGKYKQKLGFFSCPVSTFEQYALARFIEDGYFEKHINRMRAHYKKRRTALFEKMKSHDIFADSTISGEDSGLHCIVEFRTALPDAELLREVTALGFKASMIKDYYHNANQQDCHTLIFPY